MALRLMDSFDHYTGQGDRLTKWTADINASGNVEAGTGRFGSCWPNQNNSRSMYKQFDAQATWIIGAAIRVDTFTGVGDIPLFVFLDGGSRQVYVRIQANTGKLQVIREASNSLGVGSFIFSTNVWYFIEFKATINNTTGIAVVRVNGVTDINLSSQDTQATANATADQVALNGGAIGTTGANPRYDDVYICDGTGSDDFRGDHRIEALFPNGNGTTSQLVGQDANSTDNYLNVDETAPDGDTTYNESSTVNDKDTYAYTNLTPGAGAIAAIQILPYARKTDAGVRSIKTVARHSGTEVDSADFTLATTYEYHEDIRTTKPGGGSWSVSDINAAEFGVKVSA